MGIEPLGSAGHLISAALVPDAGTTLGESAVDPVTLGRAVVEGVDALVGAIAGEGMVLVEPDNLSMPTATDLILLKLPISSADGSSAELVFALSSEALASVAQHVTALSALAAAQESESAPAEASAEAVETAEVQDAPVAPQPAAAAAPAAPAAPARPAETVRPFSLPPLEQSVAAPAAPSQNIDLLLGVNLQVSVEIGRTKLPIRDVLALAPGSIVELDKLAGEKVDVLVNGHLIATGEVVVVDDSFGVRISDVVSRQRRITSAGSLQ
jgi:flagellar motor switch protein FliN